MTIETTPLPAGCDPRTDRILAASERLFLELGYTATSMSLVAQRAAVSKTTLYTRFPSKEELFVATIQAACRRYGADITPDNVADLPLEEALYRVGRRLVDLLWSPDTIMIRQSVLSEASRIPLVGHLYCQAGPQRIVSALTILFARLSGRGCVGIADPAFIARQFLAALSGGFHSVPELGIAGPPSKAERDEFTRKAVTLFIRGLCKGAA
ncbi:TetR/AcrR family transcriptional repressor of mexJK operon [Azospirillum lipoferum]|uniref:TetR/AcrR family transcriptional regulator n=1 Tax=Azospirillum lipoferum TaxID=193 RepID=A0A5A9GEP2_AZOLI|nr:MULTISPECIES: TetR/AcrR family transcriptional regulator [Azospirillum]KAA0592998.1 TetR/AcrR family transcriptional regulator [Azospirillum lipoferum]MCP1613940.1 TetR/AcrR family transcriptional repressor of mexJK operon [Azospirillum lipoferum]MDW5537666.1 TetR/AcrR family transcriptional regulator [Azospirillum sp. NL1]